MTPRLADYRLDIVDSQGDELLRYQVTAAAGLVGEVARERGEWWAHYPDGSQIGPFEMLVEACDLLQADAQPGDDLIER